MPTKKPRVIVTLERGDYDLVRKVAEASGVSMGALLREYVDMSRPMLEHLANLADSLQRAQHERREVHQEAVDRAISKGQALFDIANGQVPLFFDMVETLTSEIAGEGLTSLPLDGAAPAARDGLCSEGPPTSNTGVRSKPGGQIRARRTG